MADNMDGGDDIPQDNLKMLAYLLRKEAAPRDATFTTARGEGDLAKAQRDALEKLQAYQQMVHGPRGRGEVSVRMFAPLNYRGTEPSAVQGRQQEMFGEGAPDMGNAQAIGSRASDSLALSGLQRRQRPLLPDNDLQRQIEILKALKARNSNNPG